MYEVIEVSQGSRVVRIEAEQQDIRGHWLSLCPRMNRGWSGKKSFLHRLHSLIIHLQ